MCPRAANQGFQNSLGILRLLRDRTFRFPFTSLLLVTLGGVYGYFAWAFVLWLWFLWEG
jgi:hypothetical protein